MIWMMWMPLLVVAVLLLAFWPPQQQRAGAGEAMDIARRRLASGEIGHEEFERLRQLLATERGMAGSPPALRLGLLIAVLLIALVSSMVWAWRSADWDWGWGWGWGHMDGMMGSGRNTSGEPAQQGDAITTVVIKDYAYAPGNLELPVGARVTWTNRDSARHSATAKDRSWDTGLLSKGASKTMGFDSAGTFDYFCTLHPNMKARLVVR